MGKECPHCSVRNGPAIKELRRDAFKEAVSIMHASNFPKSEDGPLWGFEQAMTLACFLIGLGEEEDE